MARSNSGRANFVSLNAWYASPRVLCASADVARNLTASLSCVIDSVRCPSSMRRLPSSRRASALRGSAWISLRSSVVASARLPWATSDHAPPTFTFCAKAKDVIARRGQARMPTLLEHTGALPDSKQLVRCDFSDLLDTAQRPSNLDVGKLRRPESEMKAAVVHRQIG